MMRTLLAIGLLMTAAVALVPGAVAVCVTQDSICVGDHVNNCSVSAYGLPAGRSVDVLCLYSESGNPGADSFCLVQVDGAGRVCWAVGVGSCSLGLGLTQGSYTYLLCTG